MWIRTWLLAVLMLVGGPVADVSAQRAPDRPAPPEKKPTDKPAEKPAEKKPAEKPESCCRRCGKGKACGDSCISRRFTCHKPPGCACDGDSR
jgi:hypothetical protein